MPRFFTTNRTLAATDMDRAAQQSDRARGKRELRMEVTDAQVAAAKAQILDPFRTQLFQLRQAFGAAMLA